MVTVVFAKKAGHHESNSRTKIENNTSGTQHVDVATMRLTGGTLSTLGSALDRLHFVGPVAPAQSAPRFRGIFALEMTTGTLAGKKLTQQGQSRDIHVDVEVWVATASLLRRGRAYTDYI